MSLYRVHVPVPPQLSQPTKRLLIFGDVDQAYKSQRAVELALATGFIAAGLTEDELLAALLAPHNVGGGGVRRVDQRQGHTAAHTYVSNLYGHAAEYVERSGQERRVLLDQLRSEAEAVRWSGRSGATAHKVLGWIIDLAEHGSEAPDGIVLTWSERQLAENVGIGRDTARRAVKRLDEWVHRESVGVGPRGSRYVLRYPTSHTSEGRDRNGDHVRRLAVDQLGGASKPSVDDHCDETINYKRSTGRWTGSPSLDEGHDVWRWPALGPNALRVYEVLRAEGPATAAELTRRLGLGKNTLPTKRGLLRKMELHGLVSRRPDRSWEAVDSPDFDAAAHALGTNGRGARQRQQYETERAAYSRRRLDPSTGELVA